MFKGKAVRRATRLRSNNPCAPLNNTSSPSKIFRQIPPKAHVPPVPSSESVIKTSAPLPTLFKREMLLSKWNENVKKWCGLWAIGFETLSVRAAVFDSYIFINFRLEKTENSPTSKKNSAGMEDEDG